LNVEEILNIYGKIKVLHLDDEELQLKILKDNLELINKDIIIDSEININSAIEKIKTNSFDCILLDYLMPIYDGIKISKKIRSISDIPIILYTIERIENVSKEVFDLEINDYCKKDVGINHYKLLNKKICEVVNKYRIKKVFNKILQNVTDSIVIIDKNYKIIFYNDKFLINYDEKDVIGIPIINLIEDLHRESLYNYLLNKEEKYIEAVIENSNKIKYNVEIHKSVISINEEFIILNIKDVTIPIIKSDIVNSSDDRFNAIANMSPDAIMTMNFWGYITYMNEAFSRLTGYSENEIVGKHLLQMPTIEGRDLNPYLDLLKSFLTGKSTTKSFEFPYSRKDGTSGIGDAYIDIIKVNKKRELIGILRDITDKKKKEEEYQNIFKTSPEGIIHLDLNGNIKDINSSGLQMLQIDISEYKGKSIFEVDGELKNKNIGLTEIYNNMMNEKSIKPFQIELNINNELKYIEINVSLIKIFEEKLGMQIILRDITQQIKIEKERIAYTDKLETLVQERTNQIVDNEKMVTLAKVSSMLAHDLKGPLQVINNSLYLLKLKPDDQEQLLEYIKNAVKQVNELIDEMRTQGTVAPPILEIINIEDIIEESLIQIKTFENIKFEKIIKSNKKIKLDKSKFIRVFNNLFKNAIEAMPNGGKITILVEDKGNDISIKVIDTGIGIPQDKLGNLFRPFQSTKSKGMGLGLAFCKNTVESHGGIISVESELGKGTTFIISIPTIFEDKINNQDNNMINIKDTLIE
jgi:PAS domain S-box-containing protein